MAGPMAVVISRNAWQAERSSRKFHAPQQQWQQPVVLLPVPLAGAAPLAAEDTALLSSLRMGARECVLDL